MTARDQGCAHPGCDRPPSWCEIHHVLPWEEHGETELENLVMLCKQHHRLIHHSEWIVRIRDGLPEFVPPAWIDPDRTPRRQPGPMIDIPVQGRAGPATHDRSPGVRIADLDDLFAAPVS